MPGRYVYDTANHCELVTETAPVLTTGTIGVIGLGNWCLPCGWTAFLGGGLSFGGSSMTISGSSAGDGASMDVSTVSGTAYSGSVSASGLTGGSWTATAIDITSSTILAATTIAQPQDATLSFTATGPSTRITLTATAASSTFTIVALPLHFTTWTAGTIVTTVCSKDGDAYRYGMNGQMKTNEWAGIGNHTTALFWEYDTRTGRRANIDPIVNASQSPYAAFNDNPIFYYDIKGDSGEGPNGECPGDIRTNSDGSKSKYDGKTWQSAYDVKDMHISEKGKSFIEAFDPFGTKESNTTDADGNAISCPFNDCRGNATVANGHLLHHGPLVGPSNNAEEAKYQNGIDKIGGNKLLDKDIIERGEKNVKHNVTVPLTQNEFDGLVIANFNGQAGPALFKMVNSNQVNERVIEYTFTMYAHAKNPKTGKLESVKGLVIRAEKTVDIYIKGVYNSKH